MAKSRGSRRAQMARETRPLNMEALRGVPLSEVGPGGDSYQVQKVGPSAKIFTCPGCMQSVGPGVEHVVVWPNEAPHGFAVGVAARRHWHSSCWGRRLRPQ